MANHWSLFFRNNYCQMPLLCLLGNKCQHQLPFLLSNTYFATLTCFIFLLLYILVLYFIFVSRFFLNSFFLLFIFIYFSVFVGLSDSSSQNYRMHLFLSIFQNKKKDKKSLMLRFFLFLFWFYLLVCLVFVS